VVGELGLGQFPVHAERHAERAPPTALQPKSRVLLVFAHRPHVAHARGRDQEPDPGIPHAERSQSLELLGDVVAEALPSHHGVDRLRPQGPSLAENGAGVLRKSLPEDVDSLALDLQAGGGTMPAEPREVLGASLERREEVEIRHSSAGSSPVSIRVDPDQADGHAVPLGKAGSDDSDDSGVPALTREDQCGCRCELGRQIAARSLGRIQHLPLGVAPLPVCAVELGGDLRGPLGVLGQHQLDSRVRPVEATGGVDARPQAEGEITLVQAL